jgi:hypothetical protein
VRVTATDGTMAEVEVALPANPGVKR